MRTDFPEQHAAIAALASPQTAIALLSAAVWNKDLPLPGYNAIEAFPVLRVLAQSTDPGPVVRAGLQLLSRDTWQQRESDPDSAHAFVRLAFLLRSAQLPPDVDAAAARDAVPRVERLSEIIATVDDRSLLQALDVRDDEASAGIERSGIREQLEELLVLLRQRAISNAVALASSSRAPIKLMTRGVSWNPEEQKRVKDFVSLAP